jgi:hypothetical protein
LATELAWGQSKLAAESGCKMLWLAEAAIQGNGGDAFPAITQVSRSLLQTDIVNIWLGPTPVEARNTRLKCRGLNFTKLATESKVMFLSMLASINSTILDTSVLLSVNFDLCGNSSDSLCRKMSACIAQCGDAMMRRLLFDAAHVILKPPPSGGRG